jgi:hypothetical protein
MDDVELSHRIDSLNKPSESQLKFYERQTWDEG